MNPTYQQAAPALHAEGLQTLPARGKACYLKGWPVYGRKQFPRDVFTSLAAKYKKHNTALILGPVCPLFAIDIDIDDEEEANHAKQIAFEMFGPTPLIRLGRAGRLMLFYRKTDPATPYPEARKRPVEVFANSGLVILYGKHPSGCAYRWPEADPMGVVWSTVPTVAPDALAGFITRYGRAGRPFEESPAAAGGGDSQPQVRTVEISPQQEAQIFRLKLIQELQAHYGDEWPAVKGRLMNQIDEETQRHQAA